MKSALNRLVSVSSLTLLLAGGAIAADDSSQSTSLIETPRVADRSEMSPHIGIFAGAGNKNGTDYNTSASFMADVGFQPIIPISFALQAQYEPSSIDTIGGAKRDFNTTNVLLKETLNFGGSNPFFRHTYIGTKTGVAIYSGDLETKTYGAVGGTLGFDIPLAISDQGISLGAEGTYLGVIGTDDLTPDQMSVLGAMKYWF